VIEQSTVAPLILDLYSLTDLRRHGALSEIGRAFDADDRLRPDRMDVRDPIRNRITSAEAYLASAELRPASRRSSGLESILFDRRSRPRLGGAIDYSRRPPGLAAYAHRMYLATESADGTWFQESDHLAALGLLFGRLAGAFDAFYGFITDNRLQHQQMFEFGRARQRGEDAPPIPGPFTDRTSLRDVYWLMFFGPAFVEQFGVSLDGLGVRREETSNGGLVVWAAETPWLFDERVASVMDYDWKRPFHDALGRDTFVHVGQPAGQYVPSAADHLRFVRTALQQVHPPAASASPEE
jgi:hypothetical protein